MRRLFLLIVSLIAFSVWAQPQGTLSVSPGQIRIDGVRGPDEYTFVSNLNDMELSLRRLPDNRLAFHYRARTSGWIALGFGSQRMHGAHILIGYVTNRSVYEEHTGVFHTHRKTAETVLRESVLLESDGYTSWEGILDAGRFLGGSQLEMILAYGTRDNFTTKHQANRSLSISLR